MRGSELQTSETGRPYGEEVAGVPASYSRSTIAFPYASLKDVELVVNELHETWGGKASPEQLAASLKASPKSGAFRMKVAAARMFGAVSVARESLTLTALGRRLVDPSTNSAARVETFMTVPLFAALTEEYKGVMLPPDSGLERKIHELGVSPKQAARARQAFQRSAELAGFFKHGRQRLVHPPSSQGEDSTKKQEKKSAEKRDAQQDSTIPAALVDLWMTLLDEGGSWSPEKIQEFLETARKLRTLLTTDD
jgi:hypothetical protein